MLQFLVHTFTIVVGSGRTLREGPLESSPIKKILKEHFANSWVLIHELKSSVNDSSLSATLKHKYNATLGVYRYVILCTGMLYYVQVCYIMHRHVILCTGMLYYIQVCYIMYRYVILCTGMLYYVQVCYINS